MSSLGPLGGDPLSSLGEEDAPTNYDASIDEAILLAYQEDTFDVNSLANYTEIADSGSGAWSIVGGQLIGTNGDQDMLVRSSFVQADGAVEADFLQADDAGLVLRVQDSSSYYLVTINDDSVSVYPNTMRVYSRVGGGYSNFGVITGFTMPRGVLSTIRFEAIGTAIKVYFNGALVGSYTDSAVTAAGKLGVRSQTPGPTRTQIIEAVRWDFDSGASGLVDAASSEAGLMASRSDTTGTIVTPATVFNTADENGAWTLADAGKTADTTTADAGSPKIIRSDVARSTGKFYFEVLWNSGDANPSSVPTTPLYSTGGNDPNTYSDTAASSCQLLAQFYGSVGILTDGTCRLYNPACGPNNENGCNPFVSTATQYFGEVQSTSNSFGLDKAGVAAWVSAATMPGQDNIAAANGWWSALGKYMGAAYGNSAVPGDVLRFAVDLDAGKIWCGKNGSFFNSENPATGGGGKALAAGTYAPAIATYDGNALNATLRTAVGSTSYTVPDGFEMWDAAFAPSGLVESSDGEPPSAENFDVSAADVVVDLSTWNPADKTANVVLSDGNKTATHITEAGFDSVRGTRGIPHTGEGYFEVLSGAGSGAFKFIGVATLAADITEFVGNDAFGWGYYQGNGNKYTNGVGSAQTNPGGTTWNDGAIIGVAFKNGSVWFSKNGVWNNDGNPATGLNPAFTGITGTIYPMGTLQGIGGNEDTWAIRAKASEFTYAAPFAAWEKTLGESTQEGSGTTKVVSDGVGAGGAIRDETVLCLLGDALTDLSSHHFTVTPSNYVDAPALTTFGGYPCFNFNGGGRLTMPGSGALLAGWAGDFAFECLVWFKGTAPTNQVLISNYASGTGRLAELLFGSGGSTALGRMDDTGGANTTSVGSATVGPDSGQWRHALLTKKANVVGAAIDGQWGPLETMTQPLRNSVSNLIVGVQPDGPWGLYGYMRNVRVELFARQTPGVDFTPDFGPFTAAGVEDESDAMVPPPSASLDDSAPIVDTGSAVVPVINYSGARVETITPIDAFAASTSLPPGTLADSAPITDAPNGQVPILRTVEEQTPISDESSTPPFVPGVAGMLDGLNAQEDQFVSILAAAQALDDVLNAAEAFETNRSFGGVVAEALTIMETAASVVTLNVFSVRNESAPLTDAANSGAASSAREVLESLFLDDAITPQFNATKSISETLSLTNVQAGMVALTGSLVDGLTLADTITRMLNANAATTEALNAQETQGRSGLVLVAIAAEQLNAIETATNTGSHLTKTLTDSLTAQDTITPLAGSKPSVQDTLGLIDAFLISGATKLAGVVETANATVLVYASADLPVAIADVLEAIEQTDATVQLHYGASRDEILSVIEDVDAANTWARSYVEQLAIKERTGITDISGYKPGAPVWTVEYRRRVWYRDLEVNRS